MPTSNLSAPSPLRIDKLYILQNAINMAYGTNLNTNNLNNSIKSEKTYALDDGRHPVLRFECVLHHVSMATMIILLLTISFSPLCHVERPLPFVMSSVVETSLSEIYKISPLTTFGRDDRVREGMLGRHDKV